MYLDFRVGSVIGNGSQHDKHIPKVETKSSAALRTTKGVAIDGRRFVPWDISLLLADDRGKGGHAQHCRDHGSCFRQRQGER